MTFDLEKARADLALARSAKNTVSYEACNALGWLPEALAEIERLRAELASANVELMAAGEIVVANEARKIAELEDALKEEKAWTSQYQKWLIEEVAEGMSENGFADDDLRQRARDSLLIDGKIGPDASKPRSWQITEERKAALKRLYGLLVVRYKYSYPDETETLRSMLQEAGQ